MARTLRKRGLSSVERSEVREPPRWEAGWGWAGDRGLDVEWEKPEAAGNLWFLVRPQGIGKSFDKDCLTSKKF